MRDLRNLGRIRYNDVHATYLPYALLEYGKREVPNHFRVDYIPNFLPFI